MPKFVQVPLKIVNAEKKENMEVSLRMRNEATTRYAPDAHGSSSNQVA